MFWPRWVSGRPIDAAQPSAAVMPGTTSTRDACSFERCLFLAAAAEDVGIAALEAHDAAPGLGFGDQDAVDLALLGRGLIGSLADRNADRIAARHFEDGGADKAVVDDDVGFDQLALSLQRQQFRIAGAGAHERDAPSRWGGVSGKRGFKLAGIGRRVAGQIVVADRSEKILLPEVAAREARRHGAGDTTAQSFRGHGEAAERCREHRIDASAQALAQNRSRAFGADRHDDRIAIDDRRAG